jgi:hypothetical protein
MLETFYLRSNSERPPLRIGLMLDSLTFPAWIVSIIQHILASNLASIELLIFNGIEQNRSAGAPKALLPVRAWRIMSNPKRRSRLLYNAYTKWDEKKYRPASNPFTPRDCTEMLHGVRRIVVHPQAKGFTHRFTPADIETIRASELDVIFRFGFNIIRGDILKTAKYGVWSFHHGDNDWYRGGPPHFWELVERHPVSGVLLQVLSDELDAGMVLCKANVATFPGMSVTLNRVSPFWVGSLFAIRKLYELHQYGWEYLAARAVPNRPAPGRDRIYRAPDNGQMVRFLAPRIARKLVQKLVNPDPVMHWKMAIRIDRARFLSPHRKPDMNGFRWVEEPAGHFYADPFLFEKNGTTWVFFEDFLYDRKQAVIACAEILPDASIGPVQRVLERPYHLSYPQIFEHDGEIFLLPETGDNRTVELYRCVRFPDQWQLEKTLFSGAPAWDPTVWMDGGRFWFFVTLLDPPAAGPQLYLFHSDSLTGEWKWHPANPICSDERRARGAGALFHFDDAPGRKLIRPSQDCTVTYGYSFSWNEVLKLTPDDYEEQPLFTVLPDWSRGLEGTHTYNRTAKVEVVDGKWMSRMSHHTSAVFVKGN